MATAVRDEQGRFTSKQDKTRNGNGNLGLIAGAATAGAALGIIAMLGRKAVVQAPTALAGNWADALAAEHKATLKIFDKLEATSDDATLKRKMLLAQLKHALAKHAMEEENVIYPALRDAGRTDEADALTKEHGYVKQYLYDLEKLPPHSADFLPKLREFRADIEAHMDTEESHLFPSLRAQLDEEANKTLTTDMNKEGFKLA